MRIADAMMAYVSSRGVDKVFFLPGGGAMHLNDALAQSGIKAVHCHHEQACAIAAEAWGRMKGIAGVAMVTTGPGATNAITPVAGAWIESSPMLVLSGQVKRADLLKGTGLRQKGVQEVDIVSLVSPICKMAKIITEPGEALESLILAWRLANSGRKGPCWIDVPLDIQAAPYVGDWASDAKAIEARLDVELPVETASADALMLPEVLVDAITKSKRPLFLIGHGARLAGAQDLVAQFLELHGIPAVFTWNAMDILPSAHPLNAGRPGVVAARCANFAVQQADLLVCIGARMDNIVTAYNPKAFGRNAYKAMFDIDPHELAKLDNCVDYRAIARVDQALDALGGHFKSQQSRYSDWHAKIAELKRFYPARDGQPVPASGPVGSSELSTVLSQAIPEGHLIATGSSGLCIEAFYSAFENKAGQRVFLTSGLGSMGYGLPAAIGACEAYEGRPAVLVESDGSLMLNLQELSTLSSRQPNLAIVLMDNSGYASIRATQRNYFSSRFLGTGAEAAVSFPHWPSLFESFSIPYLEVSDMAGLQASLDAILDPSRFGPRVLRVLITPDEALWPKCSAIPLPDGSMLSMPLEDMSPLLPLAELTCLMDGQIHPSSIEARKPSKA